MKKTIITLGTASFMAANLSAAILINEFRPNPVGTDPASGELVELRATAGEVSFDGFWGSIEGDNATFDVQNSGSISVTFDANGLATFDSGPIENPALTFFISTSDHSGATAVVDITTAIDALGVPDQTTGDTLYGATLGGLDMAYSGDEPQSVFRDSASLVWYAVNDPAGTDTYDQTGAAVAGTSFDIDPTATPTTFGAVNPTIVPEPSSFALLGLAGLATLLRRRR